MAFLIKRPAGGTWSTSGLPVHRDDARKIAARLGRTFPEAEYDWLDMNRKDMEMELARRNVALVKEEGR